MNRLFWISWEQPTEDYRPLTYPPNPAILGWWCSGSGEGYFTLCAYVEAENEAAAEEAVLKDWPEIEHWRFCQGRDHYEPSDRFPVDDGWAAERLKKWSVKT